MEENNTEKNVYNENDTLDINELASLNDDISPELIEQLQNQVSIDANKLNKQHSFETENSSLFEEIQRDVNSEKSKEKTPKPEIDPTIDDNFIKKYKAKLNKQSAAEQAQENNKPIEQQKTETPLSELESTKQQNLAIKTPQIDGDKKEIENLSKGNIIEKPITKEQISYNDSLDLLDENIKYSKYVIYIDPENTDFIESLTVKERKNLINRILREQDDIAITKKRLNTIQTIIKHSIVAIITITLAVPVIYFTINASLEATINNHRRSQKIFQTLYREKGKIKTINTN